MKKMLMTASVPSMIGQFNMNNINILLRMGYEVHIATNFRDYSYWSRERIREFIKELKRLEIHYHQIDFCRNPKDVKKIIYSFKQMDRLLNQENFVFVHCHTPIAGVISRICCHRHRIKVIYTAHGFHFYDGAPLKNWVIFYPVEKWLSKYTDVLITINREDYKRASREFKATKTVYVPGVGIDTKKFAPRQSGREKIRKELAIREEDTMLFSVGELNENKNHEAVIRAISGLDITYVIIGKGELRDKLESIAKEYDVDLRLLGLRDDVADFYDAADVYVLPSIREDLNVSLMEAMASGLAVACGNIRGNTDLVSESLFDPTDINGIRIAINTAIENREEFGRRNIEKIRSFDFQIVENQISEIYWGYEHIRDLFAWQQKRTEIGINWNAKLLISVGELSIRKNHKVVVKALQQLPKEYWYIVVGKGEMRNELESMDKTGRLKFLGYRTDIVDLLHASDLFVFPSLQEGLPVALMEAMASGLPCICSRIRGNTDLIDSNLNGVFIDNDAMAVAKTIKLILNKKNYLEMTKQSLRIIKTYDIRNIRLCMKLIYKKMAC